MDLFEVITWILGTVLGVVSLHAIFVAPRVYYAVRTERTVRIMSPTHRAAVESKLETSDVPTGFCEVEWWNQGHRTSQDITLEVRLPVPILSWEAQPGAEDITGPWRCTNDPGATGRDPTTLRLKQEHLKPHASFRLVLGFRHPDGPSAASIRAYLKDRVIRPSRPMSPAIVIVALVVWLGISGLVTYCLGWLVQYLWPWFGATAEPQSLKRLAQGMVGFALLLGPAFLLLIPLLRFLPRAPSWEAGGSRESR